MLERDDTEIDALQVLAAEIRDLPEIERLRLAARFAQEARNVSAKTRQRVVRVVDREGAVVATRTIEDVWDALTRGEAIAVDVGPGVRPAAIRCSRCGVVFAPGRRGRVASFCRACRAGKGVVCACGTERKGHLGRAATAALQRAGWTCAACTLAARPPSPPREARRPGPAALPRVERCTGGCGLLAPGYLTRPQRDSWRCRWCAGLAKRGVAPRLSPEERERCKEMGRAWWRSLSPEERAQHRSVSVAAPRRNSSEGSVAGGGRFSTQTPPKSESVTPERSPNET